MERIDEGKFERKDVFLLIREKIIRFISIRKNQILVLGIFLFFILFITVGEIMKAGFFILLLFLLNFLVTYMLIPIKRFRIGIELILFSTVLCGIAYGPKVGAIVGAISALINYIAYKRVSTFVIIVIPAYMLIGVMAYYMHGIDIGFLGLFFAILYNLMTIPIILFYMNARVSKSFWFLSTNIIFNYVLFSKFGPVFLNLML